MSERSTCWSITINNPISADDENIARAKQKGWQVTGQLEQGEEGTPHYQLMVKTPQIRFSGVKAMFPRAHIEPARNVKALTSYVSKDDTRIGKLPVNDKYPTLDQMWILMSDWWGEHVPTDPDERLELFDQFIARYIEKGYHLETMGVNPQMRSCVKKYLPSILLRCQNVRRQTDRQTDMDLISESDITDEGTSIGTSETQSTCETYSTQSTESSYD